MVRDVTLRDGLQDEEPVTIESKVAIFEALVAAGVGELEVAAFVRADRVPAMADAEAVVAATAGHDVVRWGLALNRRGADRALEAGIDHLHFAFSVSEAHNEANAGQPVAASLDDLRSVAELVAARGARLDVTLATAFGCPYDGPVSLDDVIAAVAATVAVGVDGVGLADTIGTGSPREVRAAVGRAVEIAADIPVGVHLHDTRGLAIANALAAVDAGARRIDAAVGGLGGCPFAPGASGNLPTEDLVHALEAEGIPVGIDVGGLIEAAHLACGFVGRRADSHVAKAGPRFAAPAPPRG